jgi:hypothetical protein
MIISALLLPGPMMIGDGVGLDVHTLLVGAMGILVGVQSITFGFMARSLAMANGIIPRSERFKRFLSGMTLERLLVLAAGLFMLGLLGISWAGYKWSAVDFGALEYRDVMRILIASLTLLVAGLQLGFSAFFLGVMQIKHK